MKSIMKLFAAFVVALTAAFALPASAAGVNSAGVPDYSGNWWNPSQNGWGLTVVEQNNIIFVLAFVYNAPGQPMFLQVGGPLQKNPQTGQDFLVGPLAMSFGSQPMNYDVTKLKVASVGTATITFSDPYHATFTYNYVDPSGGPTQSGSVAFQQLTFGCNSPQVWNGSFCVYPQGTKVAVANQLPQGCNTWKDPCWAKALKDGTVKLVSTSATMTGYSNRPVMIAYYKNTMSFAGVSGLWDTLIVYADDGSPVGGDISDGGTQPIDWMTANATGPVRHFGDTGTCAQGFWAGTFWDYGPTACPTF